MAVKPGQRRLSVDIPQGLYAELLEPLQFGNQRQLIVKLLETVNTQMKQGQQFLATDIASGKRARVELAK